MRYKKATKLAAPEYVDALMNWAQGLLDNEDLFPSEMGEWSPRTRSRATVGRVRADHPLRRARTPGKPFAKSFRDTIGRLFRRLFRVYAHLYSNHFDHICALGIEGAGFLSGRAAPLSPVLFGEGGGRDRQRGA